MSSAQALVDGYTHNDARRKYYQLTPLGRDVVAEEARRMAAAVDLAREKKLITSRAT